MGQTEITTIEALEALYGTPSEASLAKVTPQLTQSYKTWIAESRFCVISTVGPTGVDGSPRGDVDPVVKIADDKTLLLPDWRGNNRMDSLRNLVHDPRIAVMFMLVGSDLALRVNGRAKISTDPKLTLQFEQKGRHPKTVIVITIEEVYAQCSKAILRSDLWDAESQSDGMPTLGQMVKDAKASFDADAFDAAWYERAKSTLW
ncbi:MAG: pyridoxamine 5'-phosphate oxidase family protein [Halocynthiibacter sp.]